MAIGGHHNPVSKSDVWLSPPYILQALGPFDLDPCAAEEYPTWAAPRYFTERVNGLAQDWSGRVWLNPPYGRQTGWWLKRLADHGNGIALIFARTETAMFFDHVWPAASGIFFFEGRINFYHPSGIRAVSNAGAPSCLVAYGHENVEALRNCTLPGKFIALDPE